MSLRCTSAEEPGPEGSKARLGLASCPSQQLPACSAFQAGSAQPRCQEDKPGFLPSSAQTLLCYTKGPCGRMEARGLPHIMPHRDAPVISIA